jgi:hypothetical protein
MFLEIRLMGYRIFDLVSIHDVSRDLMRPAAKVRLLPLRQEIHTFVSWDTGVAETDTDAAGVDAGALEI